MGLASFFREVSEWLKEHAWKVCMRATVSRVRISSSLQINKAYGQVPDTDQYRAFFVPNKCP